MDTKDDAAHVDQGRRDAVKLIQLHHLSHSRVLSYNARRPVGYRSNTADDARAAPRPTVPATDAHKRLNP